MRSNLPAIELLESTHQFPGPYMFKAIGRSENGFIARAIAAVRDELAEPIDPPFSVREAVGGRHVSVTVTADVKTAYQVLAVYKRMRTLVGLVMLW
ncbi:MAG TPA: DUF493 domain-containing protein [Gemmataceae bacterium]|jgi:hypothetical protein